VARALYRDALGLTSRFRPATDHRTSGTISYVLANWRAALPNEGCAESNGSRVSTLEAKAVLKAYPQECMVAYQVSTRVNSPNNNDPVLIEPVDSFTTQWMSSCAGGEMRRRFPWKEVVKRGNQHGAAND
jgi:hypothetical protein